FCLHRGFLGIHSPAMEEIFTLPSGFENDGADEDHPINLPGISGSEFEHFVSWLYHIEADPVPPEQNLPSLVAILKVSWLWQIDNSIAWAITCVRVYSIIARAHEVMEKEQCTMAAVPPGLSLPPSLACNPLQHAHCKDVWACFWWQKAACQLLHPYNPLPLSSLVGYI
ncbi:hypothetical protein SCLCIDRAFT_67338, partial [Scleroderma citrinum Foug A]